MSLPHVELPISDPIVYDGKSYSIDSVFDQLAPLLTEPRLARIKEVVAKRTMNLAVVLEDIYDFGNTSAVMRSAEALGVLPIHHIVKSTKFKVSQRVTKGAEKWLLQSRWNSTTDCFNSLKSQGYKIAVTHLSAHSVPIEEIDFTHPTALVFGNEQDGISAEAADQADYSVIIPMHGFVQSFNISVAAALSLHYARLFQDKSRQQLNQLTTYEERKLLAYYILMSHPERQDMIGSD